MTDDIIRFTCPNCNKEIGIWKDTVSLGVICGHCNIHIPASFILDIKNEKYQERKPRRMIRLRRKPKRMIRCQITT